MARLPIPAPKRETAAMRAPEVKYAKSGDVNIAYSVVGDGPFDVVFVVGWVISTLDLAWDGPPAQFFERLSSSCRLILFDKRGTGLSDRVQGIPNLETRMDDVRAVMDAAGSKRAALFGVSEGGFMTSLFAATYPERTAAVVLYGTGATYLKQDDYPWASTRDQYEKFMSRREMHWGDTAFFDELLEHFAPSLAGTVSDETRQWWYRYLRTSVSPGAAAALTRMNKELDTRRVLPTIRVPTLVLHVEGDQVFELAEGSYIADHIPGAELTIIPGQDHAWFAPAVRDLAIAEAERFLTDLWERGEWEDVEADRVLATVLFTDIVDSTSRAAELGDRAWSEILTEHHTRVRRQLARFRGREIDTAGDGFFASFDGPARAIRCAQSITESVDGLGIAVRCGLHTGECEQIDGKMGGIAVHIGARVAGQAGSGEVVVSSTVKDLVAGSGISFSERGVSELKGLPGQWALYSVEREPAALTS